MRPFPTNKLRKTLQPVQFSYYLHRTNAANFSRKSSSSWLNVDRLKVFSGMEDANSSAFSTADLRKTTTSADIPPVTKTFSCCIHLHFPCVVDLYDIVEELWRYQKFSGFLACSSVVPGSQWVEAKHLRLQGSCCRAHCSCLITGWHKLGFDRCQILNCMEKITCSSISISKTSTSYTY